MKATEADLTAIGATFDRPWVTPVPLTVALPNDLPLALQERLHDRQAIEDLQALVHGYRQVISALLTQIQVQRTYIGVQAKTIEGYREDARSRAGVHL